MNAHVLPQAHSFLHVEAEQQVLGHMLLDQAQIGRFIALGGADAIQDPMHADLFARMRERDKSGELVSPVSMKGWADAHAGISQVGGAAYLVRMAASAISSESLPGYVDILREAKAKADVFAAVSEAATALTALDEDAAVIAGRLEAAILSGARGKAPRPVSMAEAAVNAVNASLEAYHGGGPKSVTTGFRNLDNMTGGFCAGELILIGGRPSMGKSALALNMATGAAKSGKVVAICSLEMTPEAMAIRAIAEEASRNKVAVKYSDIRRGQMNEQQAEAMSRASIAVSKLPVHFLPKEYRDIGALIAGVRQIKRTQGALDMLVVDYAQLLQSKASSRYEQITEISIALKGIAMDLQIPVVALSQLSRGVEQRDDKRPMLSDLRESGQLEQDADAVMFCYRPEYYVAREEPDHGTDAHSSWLAAMEKSRGRMEVIIAKQRQGQIGTAYMGCNLSLNRIWEW